MAQSPYSKRSFRGFTLLEVLVSLALMSIGLVSVAALLAQTVAGTSRTEYMTEAATLASEKLEDLNRYPSGDPNVAVTTGATAGSLTANTSGSVTSNGLTENVDYFDSVFFSPTEGAVSETISSPGAGGTTVYTTTSNDPDGIVHVTTSSSLTSVAQGKIYFERRWIIEKDQPLVGLRRVTVLVTLKNASVQPGVTFQLSMVRP